MSRQLTQAEQDGLRDALRLVEEMRADGRAVPAELLEPLQRIARTVLVAERAHAAGVSEANARWHEAVQEARQRDIEAAERLREDAYPLRGFDDPLAREYTNRAQERDQSAARLLGILRECDAGAAVGDA
jgi:hypothetical protein